MGDPFAENALIQRRMRLTTERVQLQSEVISGRPTPERSAQIQARIAEIDQEIAGINAQLGPG